MTQEDLPQDAGLFVSNIHFFYIYARFLTNLGLFNGSSQISKEKN